MLEGLIMAASRFIVAPRTPSSSGAMADLVTTVKSDQHIQILKSVGSPSMPKRVVLSAEPDAMEKLRSQFADTLLIEEDQPLNLA
jgi:hypothetical protein